MAIDSRDEFESGAAQCFNEFVLYSIETFLLDRNVRFDLQFFLSFLRLYTS